MALTDDLLTLAKAYCDARRIALPTLSTQILNDGRALNKVLAGTGTITLRNFERCIEWLSNNWPGDVPWPDGVDRPTVALPPNPDRAPGERAGLTPQQAEEAA